MKARDGKNPTSRLFICMATLVIAVCGAFFVCLHFHRLSLLRVERTTSFHEQAALITRLVREFFYSPLNSTDLAEIIFPLAAQDKPLDGGNLALLSSDLMRTSERSVGILTRNNGWRLDLLAPNDNGSFTASQLSADASGRIGPATQYAITPGVAGNAEVESGVDPSLILQIAQGLQNLHSGGSSDLILNTSDNHELLVIPGEPVSLPAAQDGTVVRRTPFVTVDKDRLGKLGPQLSVAGTLPVILCISRSDLNPIVLYRRSDISDSAVLQLCASMDLNLLAPDQTDFTRDITFRDDAQTDRSIKLLCIDVPENEWKVWAGYDWNAILQRPVAAGERVPESVVWISFLAICLGGAFLIKRFMINPLRGIQKRMHALRNLNPVVSSAVTTDYMFRELQGMNLDLLDIERTMRALATYVPETVTETLLGDSRAEQLRPTRVDMTVLFVPLPVHTDWLNAPDAFAVFERFLSELKDVFRPWPSALCLFQHDGICLCWRNEIDGAHFPDNIANSVAAARAVIQLMEQVNRGLTATNTGTFPSVVGIYSGADLFCGSFGETGRRMYTVIGEGMRVLRVCCELANVHGMQIVCNEPVAKGLNQTSPVRPVILTQADLAMAPYWEIAPVCAGTELIDHRYVLFSDYFSALDKLRTGDCDEAQRILQKMLDDNPADRLTRILLDLCQQRLNDNSTYSEVARVLAKEQ